MERAGRVVPIIAKIEKPEALDRLDAIIAATDGIMVARGDLGVETPLQHVPLLQKMLIEKSNRAGKPVITATQMLRSMVDCPRPTRAEAADVANAILDGTDAVMLSEETASGRFPIEALEMMVRIAEDAETAFPYDAWRARVVDQRVQSLPEAVADAACTLADDIGAAAIVACTQGGTAARLVAQHRPRRPILALTPLAETSRRLALVWGVVPVVVEMPGSTDEMLERIPGILLETGLVRSGDPVVITAGIPMGVSGSTNSIKAAVIQ
jgi:pyruvate kinase